jgi:putative ABC transport system permease protein
LSLLRLVLKNIAGNAFRSLAVFFCAALVASLVLAATFVVRGAEASLRLNLQRLGADILVLPWGTMTEKIGGVRLMSAAIDGWMPLAYLERIAALAGVDEVSPQLHLASLQDSPYCPRPEMYVVAYDPATDFTLDPWLEQGMEEGLGVGEAIAGARITIPGGGSALSLFGYPLDLVDRLEPTATSIDDTVFVNFETAEEMLAWSQEQGIQDLEVMPGSISAIMVKLTLGSDPHEIAVRILEQVPGVVPLETPGLFQAERQQMIGVLRTMLSLLGVIWALTLVFLGLVFAVAANERRWEIGVLRALGLSRSFVLKELLLEGATLALIGGFVGVIGSIVGFSVLGDQVVRVVKLPLQFPSPLGLLSISLAGQAMALVSVALAAFIPAWRISHQEVALTMRECI